MVFLVPSSALKRSPRVFFFFASVEAYYQQARPPHFVAVFTHSMILRCVRWQSTTGFTRVTTPYLDSVYRPIIAQGIRGLDQLVVPKDFHAGNQEVVIDRDQQRLLEGIIELFEAPMQTLIGYGSGVLPQAGYTKQDQQIDFINVVGDANQFHRRNLQQYPGHYLTKNLALLRWIQGKDGIYFNPFCPINGHTVKYGTVLRQAALHDLLEWTQLYFAGRLHKPVNFVRDNDPMVKFLNQYNLKNALTLSVFMLGLGKPTKVLIPETFSERQLYEQITRLSYMGDFRMKVGGENPHKVKNIVEKQFNLFKQVYEPIIDYFVHRGYLVISESGPNKVFRANLLVNHRIQLVLTLPLGFRKQLYGMYQDKLIKEIAKDPKLADNMQSVVLRIIWLLLIKQAIRGVLLAGLIQLVKYALAKNAKFWKLRGEKA